MWECPRCFGTNVGKVLENIAGNLTLESYENWQSSTTIPSFSSVIKGMLFCVECKIGWMEIPQEFPTFEEWLKEGLDKV